MIKPQKVIAHDDFTITIYFDNGKKSKVDMSFIFSEQGEVVDPLKKWEHFQKVYVVDDIITWPSGYDIDPHYLSELCQQTSGSDSA